MKRLSLLVGFAVVSLALLFIAIPARADDLTVGLVSCWDLDEASGSRVDAWSTNDLTDNNTVGSTTGIINDAADFVTANNEWLSVADNPEISLSNDTDFTISAWVYRTISGAATVIVDKGISNGQQRWHEFNLYANGGNLFAFEVGDGAADYGSLASGETAANNTWYFVIAWHNTVSDTINLQVNNGTIYTADWAGGTHDSSGSLAVGRRGDFSAQYWDGRIDQVVYWKGQLINDADRTWLYNSGAGRDCAEIADTVPTPTPTETATPSATPTGTPEPTVTPTPGPKIYEIDLPEGGRGEVVMSVSAGEFAVASFLAGIAAVLLFAQLVNLAYMNTKR
jgi:hypothetical protein